MPPDALQTHISPAQAPQPGLIPSQVVIASMRKHGIDFSADNYAVWQSYLAGTNVALKRAIDIVLSNGHAIEERALRALYVRHFCHVRDVEALRDIARRTLATVGELRGADAQASIESSGMASFLERLGGDLAYLSTLGEQLTRKLAESEARIAQLEFFLNDARQEACTDGLTGVANRRALDAALRGRAGDAMNEGSDLGFVLLDIDHFKQVNDNWGHQLGDEVLRMVAATLTSSVRGTDMVARYGGEEFAVILPGAGPPIAAAIADALRARIAEQLLVVPGGAAAGAQARSIAITISAGVSCYEHGEQFAAWMGRADQALYEAKKAGRNRVVLGEIDPAAPARPSNVVLLSPAR